VTDISNYLSLNSFEKKNLGVTVLVFKEVVVYENNIGIVQLLFYFLLFLAADCQFHKHPMCTLNHIHIVDDLFVYRLF